MPDLTHVQRIRQEMPAVTAHIYLNTGTFGPMPSCVVQSIQEYIQHDWQQGRLGAEAFERISATYNGARQAVARLLHASEQEITLTDNTGEGLNIISHGFNWREGDEVITTNHEHISLLGPLYQLRDRYGALIRIADIGPFAAESAAQAVADLITPRTRLISLSHVTWSTGARLDIRELTTLAHAQGVPVLIDGAQSAGAIPIDVKELGIDFYAIPMQKWLCGPDGTGALYVRSESLNHVSPTYVGYMSTKHEDGIEWELVESAARFELGGRQTAAVAGQVAVLNWLNDVVGFPWLYERIASLNTYAASALRKVPGLTLLSPRPGDSGLLAFTLEGQDPTEVMTYLNEQHNINIRTIPTMNSLRVSTGFYNTEEEIDTLARALTQYQESR